MGRDPQAHSAGGSAVEGDPFYRAFEDVFRGSRESIRRRLEAYVPIVEALKQLADHPRVMDLGCGRGEWLELMRDNGFDAVGVDLDEAMLTGARELGLSVAADDALQALERQASSSLHLVSAFHLVEHLPFDVVRALVRETRRVLAPGGLLILETPNPENLGVGAHTFYLDPTHVRPIPSALLRFAVGYEGFPRHWLLRLNEQAGTDGSRILDVLEGVSPDYAVLGQVPANADFLKRFDLLIASERGRSLSQAGRTYDESLRNRLLALTADVETLKAQIDRVRRPWVLVKKAAYLGRLAVTAVRNRFLSSVAVPATQRLLRNALMRRVLARAVERYPNAFGRLRRLAARTGVLPGRGDGSAKSNVGEDVFAWIAWGDHADSGHGGAGGSAARMERHLTSRAKCIRSTLEGVTAPRSRGDS